MLILPAKPSDAGFPPELPQWERTAPARKSCGVKPCTVSRLVPRRSRRARLPRSHPREGLSLPVWCEWTRFPAQLLDFTGRKGSTRANSAIIYQGAARGLRGAGEVCVYADLPLIQQPFWDVAAVPVLFAPAAQVSRGGIGLWHQVQLPNLHFEFGAEDRSREHGTAPVRIAAFSKHKGLTRSG